MVEMLKLAGKVNIVYTSFNGGAASVTAAAGGHVSGVIANYSEVAPQVSAGKLRAMAVGERSRIDLMPEVPTISEAGVPGYETVNWWGLASARGTPQAVIRRINADVKTVLSQADVQKRLVNEGAEAVRHLFRVASSLDSMVLGEPQILGQVKQSVRTAESSGTLGSQLNRLFQHTFSVAKEVRTQTAIGEQSISMSAAALKLAQNLFGDIKSVSCLGATHLPQRWNEAGKPYKCTADDSAYATFELKNSLTKQTVADAVAAHVRGGDVLHPVVGHTRWSAATREVVRQWWGRDPGFTLVMLSLSSLGALFFRGGLVRRVITVYSGDTFPNFTPNPRFAGAYERGEVEVEHWSFLAFAQRLEAGQRLGLQPTVGQFLDAVGQAALDVLPIERGGSLSNSSRHCSLSLGVGVVFSAVSLASTGSFIVSCLLSCGLHDRSSGPGSRRSPACSPPRARWSSMRTR
mgnify:CR=1 FL=1